MHVWCGQMVIISLCSQLEEKRCVFKLSPEIEMYEFTTSGGSLSPPPSPPPTPPKDPLWLDSSEGELDLGCSRLMSHHMMVSRILRSVINTARFRFVWYIRRKERGVVDGNNFKTAEWATRLFKAKIMRLKVWFYSFVVIVPKSYSSLILPNYLHFVQCELFFCFKFWRVLNSYVYIQVAPSWLL